MKQFPEFIAATREYNTYEKHVAAPYLRKTFELKNKPKKAEILVSGLGFYRLFVNGKEITKGLLAPYISSSDDMVYFDKYDIAPLLTSGKNAVGVILGNGMQNAPSGSAWDFHNAPFRSAPKFALRLTADGEIFDTNEEWKCASSPIFFDDLRSGCFYDATKEIPDWCSADFDDSKWQNAFFADRPRGEYKLCEAEPIRVQQEIKPVNISKNTLKYLKSSFDTDIDINGEPRIKSFDYQTFFGDTEGYLYDFGINTAGVYRLKIKGEKGQRVVIQAVEYLTPEGDAQNRAIGNFYPTGYGQRDIYILKGEGEEEFIPSFTYHGCRYYHISGVTEEQATPELITYLETHSDLPEKGIFNCSDEMINRLQEMCMRSAKSNFQYFPVDCPHREKNGWTGDAATSCEYMLMNFSAEKSFKEWMRNVRSAMNKNGAVPCIVPTGGWGFAWGSGPAWDRVLVYLPYYVYLYTGDKEILTENAHAIMNYLDFLSKKSDEKGLFAFGLGDWCPPGKQAEDYSSPLELTDSVMVMSICEKAAFVFGEIGLELQKKFALALYEKTRTAVRKNLIDFYDMTAIGNCQTSQAMCIYYDVFENAEKPLAIKKLIEFIAEKGGHFDTGYLGNRVIFHVLAMAGETELALNMITRPDYPSYAYPVLQFGATTLWESYMTYENASINHHFFGDISNFFIKRLAGLQINPNRTNPNEFVINPFFAEKLTFAQASYKMPSGEVKVRWQKQKDSTIVITLKMPKNSNGTIKLPQGYAFVSEKKSIDGTNTSVKKAENGKFKVKKMILQGNMGYKS